MAKYLIAGFGSPIGSIGMSGRKFRRCVEAESKEAAALKAYETHEHISGGAESVEVVNLTERLEEARNRARKKADETRRDYTVRVDHMSNYFEWPLYNAGQENRVVDAGAEALGTLVEIVHSQTKPPLGW